jgi:hypothetical protein
MGYDIPISALFWGALIVVALVAAFLLVGKAIEKPRNPTVFDGGPSESRPKQGHTKKSRFDQTSFDQTVAELWYQTDEIPLIDPTDPMDAGSSVHVIAAGDDHEGQVGIVDALLRDDGDGLTVCVKFKGDRKPYLFRRDELKLG